LFENERIEPINRACDGAGRAKARPYNTTLEAILQETRRDINTTLIQGFRQRRRQRRKRFAVQSERRHFVSVAARFQFLKAPAGARPEVKTVEVVEVKGYVSCCNLLVSAGFLVAWCFSGARPIGRRWRACARTGPEYFRV
jgi:hypothetical protein